MTRINYLTQLLISKANNTKGYNFISIDEINANFQNCMERVNGANGYKDEVLREETLVIIKLAYINIMATIKKMHQEELPGTFEEFDKTALKQQVETESKSLRQELLTAEEENAENGRINNEYKVLLIPQRIPISEVNKKYLQAIRAWNMDLDRQINNGEYDLEKNRKQERIIREKIKAHSLLSDADYKMKLDELLLFNFSPNQEEKIYSKLSNWSNISSRKPRERRDPVTGNRYYGLKGLAFGSIYHGDPVETIVYHIGNIGLGRFRQKDGKVTVRDESVVKKYKILKFYKDKELAARRRQAAMREGAVSSWDDQIGAEIFLVSGELNEKKLEDPMVDPEFIRYTQEVLLATTNLEEASIYNGGYIGRVSVTPNRREYIVKHDTEALCVSKELQKAAKITEGKGSIDTMGVIYKLDESIIELYNRDEATGQIFKEIVAATPINPIKPAVPGKKMKEITNKNDGER